MHSQHLHGNLSTTRNSCSYSYFSAPGTTLTLNTTPACTLTLITWYTLSTYRWHYNNTHLILSLTCNSCTFSLPAPDSLLALGALTLNTSHSQHLHGSSWYYTLSLSLSISTWYNLVICLYIYSHFQHLVATLTPWYYLTLDTSQSQHLYRTLTPSTWCYTLTPSTWYSHSYSHSQHSILSLSAPDTLTHN